MNTVSDYLRSVVRIFPDYADTALWFVHGPLEYTDARISDSLAMRLSAWESSYYDLLDDAFALRPGTALEEFRAEGDRLALALMAELGDAFEVEYRFDAPSGKVRDRGSGPGTNPDAVAALRALAAAHQAQHDRMVALRSRGGEFGWTAHAPTTGAEFRPEQHV